jgi:ribokinase
VRQHAEQTTGLAHNTDDAAGHNSIVVVPGANAGVSFPSAALEGASVLLAQLEVPLEVVTAALGAARAAGVTTVLNPAPARPLTERLLAMVDYLVPNESEAQHLGEVSFGGTAIITKGERGAVLLRPGEAEVSFAALRVDAVDTTAAGDAFCGCFAASIADGLPLHVSIRRASAAGAHAVTIAGALPSLPTTRDVDALLR